MSGSLNHIHGVPVLVPEGQLACELHAGGHRLRVAVHVSGAFELRRLDGVDGRRRRRRRGREGGPARVGVQ